MAVYTNEDGIELKLNRLSPTESRIVLKAVSDCEKMPDLHTLDGVEDYRLALVAICSALTDSQGAETLSSEELQEAIGMALGEADKPTEPKLEGLPLSKRQHSAYRKALVGAFNLTGCHSMKAARRYDAAMQELLRGVAGDSDEIRDIRLSVREDFLFSHLYANELNDSGETLGEALEEGGEGSPKS